VSDITVQARSCSICEAWAPQEQPGFMV